MSSKKCLPLYSPLLVLSGSADTHKPWTRRYSPLAHIVGTAVEAREGSKFGEETAVPGTGKPRQAALGTRHLLESRSAIFEESW